MGIDFSIYKNRLIDYLQLKGIECEAGRYIHCINPAHQERTASCLINDNTNFFCFGCEEGHGDIYDAVSFLEGIDNKKEQYNYLAGLFGGTVSAVQVERPEPAQNKKKRVLDPAALERVRKYMSGQPKIKEIIKDFFKKREKLKGGTYPDEVIEKLYGSFLYWPGLDIARYDLSNDTMFKAGIPYSKSPLTGNYTWGPSGLVIPLALGFKLHYNTSKKTGKTDSFGAHTFPMKPIDTTKPVVLVEGELDALISEAVGIQNVFSTGGIKCLTEEMIKTHLLAAKEIIFLYDNDKEGLAAVGATPNLSKKTGKQLSTIPDKLRKYGYTGKIKVAVLEKFKDSDECVRYGHPDFIQKAIDTAKEYTSPQENVEAAPQNSPRIDTSAPADATPTVATQRGKMTEKELRAVLKQIQLSKLDKKDVEPFIGACINAVPSYTDEIRAALEKWGAPIALLKKPRDTRPTFLVTVAEKCNLSYYYVNKIRNATLTDEELTALKASPDKPLVPIDFAQVRKNKDFENFIRKHGNKSAANLCAAVLGDRLAYSEQPKGYFYRFNGHVWEYEPNPWGVVYNILATILNYFLSHPNQCDFKNDDLYNTLVAIERRSFRNDVVKDLSVLPTIWKHRIIFDGYSTKETLTLLDGVLDFSGQNDQELYFRKSLPTEYRMKMLPYTVDNVRNAPDPKEFINFMKGNFKNDATLEGLNYYISLIPSKRTFKYGGVFIGKSNTGKTTTLNILRKVYSYYNDNSSGSSGEEDGLFVPLPADKIMARGKRLTSNGPDPFLAQLIGAGAAVCDETDKNDKIDSAMFKAYTGGGTLTVRDMWERPRNYVPTAQTIVSTNYAPKFDHGDQGVINRILPIPFLVVHTPNDKNTKSETFFEEKIAPEFPAIVKFYAKMYLEFKFKHHEKIPFSDEMKRYKEDYVENQATDLSRFVDTCIEFVKDDTKFVRLKDIYNAFIKFTDGSVDDNGKPADKNTWTQTRFTQYFKSDYNEVVIKQKKFSGNPIPEQVVLNCILKNVPQDEQETLPLQNEQSQVPFYDPPPEENPFDGGNNYDDDNQFDIF